MIVRFDTFEEASFYVQEKRAEGRDARILNESVGFLWGPRTTGGFRVEVSDEPLDSTQQEEEGSPVTRGLRSIVLFFLGLGIISLATLALSHPRMALHIAYFVGSILVVTVVGGWLLVKLLEKWFPNRR